MTELEEKIITHPGYLTDDEIEKVLTQNPPISNMCICIILKEKPEYINRIENPTDEMIRNAIDGVSYYDRDRFFKTLKKINIKNRSDEIKLYTLQEFGPEILSCIRC